MSQEEIQAIVREVEDKIGWEFEPEEVEDILRYTIRKAELNGKGADYIPILFENELRDSIMRAVINFRGEMNRCAKFAG